MVMNKITIWMFISIMSKSIIINFSQILIILKIIWILLHNLKNPILIAINNNSYNNKYFYKLTIRVIIAEKLKMEAQIWI